MIETNTETTKKMTIFYKLRNLEIDKIITGEQTLASYARLDLEDAQVIYGYIVIEYDDYIINNMKNFELIKAEDGTINVNLKEQYKTELQKYL
jgi:hypothetical protein